MTVVFVVDTSASMNQRCANGLSLLDCAKSAVEHFVKMRLRDMSWHRTDRYILVTCEDGPNAFKVVDRFPFANFMRALKSIEAHDLTQTGAALHQVFNYLHIQRLANDIDKYGQGRNPCSIEPTTILLLTDGTELTSKAGILNTIVPVGPVPLGGELSIKPFRWDQRAFAIVLRIPSVSQQVLERSGPLPHNAPISGSQMAVAMDNDISAFCESTGGKCYVATSWKVLMQHIEVTSRLSTCVVVSFQSISVPGSTGPPPQVHAACQRKLLLIRANQPHQGHWPIPEAYWPDPSQQTLPPRDPHPTIAYKAIDSDPSIPAQFIYDKYDIEVNAIASLMKASPGICWHVFIRNSKGPSNGYGDAFGYLKMLGNTLCLYVLPYNFPVLWQLLDYAGKCPKVTNLPQWRQDMERYYNGIPSYYGPPLRAALRQWGLNAHVVPDSLEKSLFAGFVGNQLKRLKAQAKMEWESMTEKVMNTSVSGLKSHERILPAPNKDASPASHTFSTSAFSIRLSSADSVLAQRTFEVSVPSGPSLSCTQSSGELSTEVPKIGYDSSNHPGSSGPLKDAALFKNPFDVPREELLSQLKYLPLRVALAMDARTTGKNEKGSNNTAKHSALGSLAARLAAKEEEEARHSLPIEKMGDFSDALWKQQPPRNPFADEQERTKQQRSLFGNPYRQEKNDAADEAWSEGSGGPQFRGRKRRRRSESPAASTTSASSAEGSSDVSSGNTEVTSPARRSVDGKGSGAQKEAGGTEDITKGTGTVDGPDLSLDSSSLTPRRYSESPSEVHHPDEATQSGRRRKIAGVDLDHASEFVLVALRALKHATSNNTHKLFEVLSATEFPVDKASLLEQLIHQAQCYKKAGVATDLTDYRNKLLSNQQTA